MIIALVLGIILGAGLTVFTLQNAGMVTVGLLSWHYSGPLAFVLVGIMCVSAAAVLLTLLPTLLRAERNARKLQAHIQQLEHELAKYHISFPIAPPAPGSRAYVFEKEPEKIYAA